MHMHPPFRIALAFAVVLLSGCAGGRHGRHQNQQDMLELPAGVPAALRVQPGQVLTLVAKATGVQIYECGVSSGDAARYQWIFKAPEASLSTPHGKSLGKHYAGPSWEAEDGSKVVARVKASDAEHDPSSIPWLLLNATANSGPGVFAHTTSVQRLFTVSGKAPVDGCDQVHLGAQARVTYSAQYYFYD